MEADRRLTFGDFSLDLASEQLLCGDEVVALTPKAFAVLRRLVEDGGQLVSKEELLRAGWAKTHVSDGVLKVDHPGDPPRARRRSGGAVASSRPCRAGATASSPPAPVRPRSRRRSIRAARWSAATGCSRSSRTGSRAPAPASASSCSSPAKPASARPRCSTRFWRRAASDPDLLIARGACLEHYGAAEAYLPVLEAFGRLLREPGAERVIRVLETHAPTWLVQLPWLEHRDDREALRRELLGVTKERMLREMAEALEALTADDPASVGARGSPLERLFDARSARRCSARRQESARLLVVGSYRPVDVIVAATSAAGAHPGAAGAAPVRGHRPRVPARAACRRVSGAAFRRACVSVRAGARRAPADGRQSALHGAGGGRARRPSRAGAGGRPLAAERTRWQRSPAPSPRACARWSKSRSIACNPRRSACSKWRACSGTNSPSDRSRPASTRIRWRSRSAAMQLARQGQFLSAAALFVRPDGTQVARYRFTHSLYPHAIAERVPAGLAPAIAPAGRRMARAHLRRAGHGDCRPAGMALRGGGRLPPGHPLPRPGGGERRRALRLR